MSQTLTAKLGPRKMSFYMYRAQSEAEYSLENINAADLSGVLWYLHNEIVITTPRKYGVRRILRLRVTMMNTVEVYQATHGQFGPFVAFDRGKCTAVGCSSVWDKYGFIVGCQLLGADVSKYTFDVPCVPPNCHAGFWYSLPGACPSEMVESKSPECKADFQGGACERVSGEKTCTFHVERAGEVSLDNLTRINNYTEFVHEGGKEYDPLTDHGILTNFWDGKHDQRKCAERMERLRLLFREGYPDMPDRLYEPPCP